jgi:hypothetical protein
VWVTAQGFDLDSDLAQLKEFLARGYWPAGLERPTIQMA